MDDPSRQHGHPVPPERERPADVPTFDPGTILGPPAPSPADVHQVSTPGGAVERTRRPRRRWPWLVALVLTIAVAGVAAGIALDQRDIAEQWRDRALALEGQRDEAIDRGDVLEGRLDELAALIETSEADVAMLEDRIRQLADEKAQAEDVATTVEVERDVVVELTNDIAEATDALDACVDRLFELQASSVEAFNQTAAGEQVDVEPLNAQARETTSFCNDARTAAARASSSAQQLTAP